MKKFIFNFLKIIKVENINHQKMKGFTLIELLIVIAILAILSTAVVLVLNPAQILAQARDSQRISDLSSVKSAIALYLSTATSPALTASTTCTNSLSNCNGGTSPFTGAISTGGYTSSTAVNGAGWVGGVNLNNTSGGSALSALPLDPSVVSPTSPYYYAYRGDPSDSTFKIMGRLESAKYRDKMKSDGGTNNTCTTYIENSASGINGCYYEVGTKMAL